jgi:hypothetical protein
MDLPAGRGERRTVAGEQRGAEAGITDQRDLAVRPAVDAHLG